MKKIFSIILVAFSTSLFAHPMPNSIIAFDVHSKTISCELQLPLKELQFAVSFDVTENSSNLLKKHKQDLESYILSHFRIKGGSGEAWNVQIKKISIDKSEQVATGKYEELIIKLVIEPKETTSIRTFTIYYDGIMHQVITHRALVTIRQDWENGPIGENNTEIGTISIDLNTNKVPPFKVNLSQGSSWKGFKSMIALGMKHISEGTDHLLFLLVLLVSAPLIAENKKWKKSGSTKYSLIRILKMVTAFTIGHSITLFIGSLNLLDINARLVEILIAFSILVTAIHAIKPIFPNKEIYVATGFGLIHGVAFATILTDINLETNKMILSLLGFNIGIELMQIIVILIIMPWLIILSKSKTYSYLRILGAIFALLASISWITERIMETPNSVTQRLTLLPEYVKWIVLFLIILTVLQLFSKDKKARETRAS